MRTQQPKTFAELKINVENIKKSNKCLRLKKDQDYYVLESKTQKVKNRIDRIRLEVKKYGWTFTQNDFPYTWLLELLPDVEHKIFWFDGDTLKLNRFLATLKAQNSDFCYFQNRSVKRSIPDIVHYQFFVLNKA